MKKALAFVVGNNDYDSPFLETLSNAVNDADDVALKLFQLGFVVIKETNAKKLDMSLAIDRFQKELENFDVGLFYFSGHAFQLRGENFLTSIDSRMDNDIYARESCTSLNFIIALMESSKVQVKIIILDACRNNPLPGNFRGTSNDLAPVHAPQGTLIAFSTSPGELAEDKGMGRNSIYTGSLLKHIDDPDIPIEALFKRVRISVVSLSKNKQTPWEHTSLVGNFYFSAGGLVHSSDLPYNKESVIYEEWVSNGSDIDNIIEDLSSTDFRDQNYASDRLQSVALGTTDISMLFLLGRKLLSAAQYGSFQAEKRINNIDRWVKNFDVNGENHILNGILFEIYFDSKGKLRTDGFKASHLDAIYSNEKNINFKSSFDFIRRQLLPFRDRIFYMPNDAKVSIEAEISEEEVAYFDEENLVKVYMLTSLKFETVELLHLPAGRRNIYNYHNVSFEKFEEFVSKGLAIPRAKLNLITKFTKKEIKQIEIPHFYSLSRNQLSLE